MLWPTCRWFLFLGLFLLLALLAGFRPRASAAPAATITRVSVSSAAEQADGATGTPVISADGRFIAFFSLASNLTPDDEDEGGDVFVHDRQTGETRRISVFPPGIEGTLDAAGPAISADGRFIVFWTSVRVGLPENLWNVYLYDQLTGTTTLTTVRGVGDVNPDRGAFWPALSGDGRFFSFQTEGANLVTDDTNGFPDIYVHDRLTGFNERVSVSSDGAQGDEQSTIADISGDGRYVVFVTDTDNLVPNDANHGNDILVRDRATGQTTRISLGPNGEQDGFGDAYFPFISFSGRYILFESDFNQLSPGDTNGMDDVFAYDQQTGVTVRVSEPNNGDEPEWESSWGHISADDSFVTFSSYATNMVLNDTNDHYDVFVRPFPAGPIERVSVGVGGSEADGPSTNSVISSDGRYVAFLSGATNLVAGDTNGVADVFVVDRGVGGDTTSLTGIVRDEAGQPIAGAIVQDWRGFAAQTDAAGTFVIESVPPGVYTLRVTKTGYTFDPPSVSTVTPTTAALEFSGTFTGVETFSAFVPVVLNNQ